MTSISLSKRTPARSLATGVALCLAIAIGAVGCATQRFVQSESMATGDAVLENWLFERQPGEILKAYYKKDLDRLSQAFESTNATKAGRIHHYALSARSFAADKLFSKVYARLLDSPDATEKANGGSLHYFNGISPCLVFPNSPTALRLLGGLRKKYEQSRQEEASATTRLVLAETLATKVGLEALDVFNLASGEPKVWLERLQVHVARAGSEREKSDWHDDGGYVAATLALAGKGTEYILESQTENKLEIADHEPRSAAPTGRFLFFAAKEFGQGEARERLATWHRASNDVRQDRILIVARFKPFRDVAESARRCEDSGS
jgi:hypothetical protein